MFFFITLLIAILGGLLGIRLKLPAGAIVGSMFLVAIFSILTSKAIMPGNTSFITQVGTGAFIGSKINRADFLKIRKLSKPVIIMLLSMMASAIATGLCMHQITHIDIVTSMFSSAPGGILDMSLICEDLGGESSITALFQTMRLAIVVSTFPSLIIFILNRQKKKKPNINTDTLKTDDKLTHSPSINNHKPYIYIFITMALAFVVGFFGRICDIPAGAMIFSMIAVALLNSLTPYGYMPLKLRKAIQFLGGATIGAKITMGSLIYLFSSWQLLLILFIGLIIMNGTSALLLYKVCKWDLTTALFAAAPGGVTDMAIIASEMGADTVSVAFMQLIRLASVIGLYPLIISVILNSF